MTDLATELDRLGGRRGLIDAALVRDGRQRLDSAWKADRDTFFMKVELVDLVTAKELAMCGRQELVKLGERIAEDGVRRHERALRELASAISSYSPGAAAVLSDPSAPVVLRERAFGVAVDVVLRSAMWSEEAAESEQAAQTDRELQRLLVDWQGQLVGWGA